MLEQVDRERKAAAKVRAMPPTEETVVAEHVEDAARTAAAALAKGRALDRERESAVLSATHMMCPRWGQLVRQAVSAPIAAALGRATHTLAWWQRRPGGEWRHYARPVGRFGERRTWVAGDVLTAADLNTYAEHTERELRR